VSTQPKRVLFIEDNDGDIELVRLRLLEDKAKFEIYCADRLSTGLTALATEKPAVVLLDLYLPDSRGADTFRAVLTRAVDLPVVVLSGCDDEALALEALQHGAQDYLVKGTFDGSRLGRTLRCAIERQALMTALNMNRREQLALNDQPRSHVSDDLLTPLTPIHQLVTAVLEDPADVTLPQRRRLGAALHKVKLLRSMINDLLGKNSVELGKMHSEPHSVMTRDDVDALRSLD
jgi:DNA-binding NarL/FixJ family response regulator